MSVAFRCGVCSGPQIWRIDRYGDAVVSWACAEHLSTECERLQRDFEVTKLQITYSPKLREWAEISQTLAAVDPSKPGDPLARDQRER